jgi:golgin subfamily B member 1
VKVLRPGYVREHVSPESWLKETERLVKLEHPNLARVYEARIEMGRCILVTENLKGRSLARIMKEEGLLTPERATEILAPICKGLQHSHEQGILHLDVMPSNIFVKEDGTPVLMDFRIGRAQKGRHVTVKKGSEGFQAPELLAGAGGDAKADVYSLGATLYNVLTGRVPIGSFQRPSELAPAARRFDALVLRALKALPEERQSVEELAKGLLGGTEAIVLPEKEDDLVGWLEVLSIQPDHERAIGAIVALEERYRKEKDWDNLVTLLLGRVEFTPSPDDRQETLKEVARIFEREVGDLGKAFTALQAAFRERSSSIEVRGELERLAGKAGMWNELLQEYSSMVQTIRDPKISCDWLVRMGRLYSNELGHDDYAIASFNQALSMDANRVDALAELAEVYKRKGNAKEYAKTLSRLSVLEEDSGKKVERLRDLARTYVKDLSSDEEAIATWRRVLEIDPHDAGAVAALEGLYRKAEMWGELVQLLRSRAETSEVADELKRYRHTLGEILSDKLKKPAEAIVEYQKLLEADPDDVVALKSLERLFDQAGRNEDYLKILERRIAAAKTADEKIALCRRMAAEWEGQEGGKARAAEYLEKVVELSGGDDESFKGLVRIYWALGDHEKLSHAYNRHIQITQKSEDRAMLYAALGKVYEDHLKDDGRAIEAFNNLLSVDASSKIALGALARLYERTEVWGQAAQLLEKLARREENVDQQVEVFSRLGVIQKDRLKRLEDAEVSLQKALELKDSHAESMLALADLYRQRKDFGKAARMLREAARHTPNQLERVKRLHAAGTTCLDDIEDEDKALEVFEELIAIDPEHLPSGERLAEIYEKRSRFDKAEIVLDMLVRKADTKNKPHLVELGLRLGRVATELKHNEKALAAYRSAYDLDPTNQTSLQKLADLLYRTGDYEEASKLFQALLVHRRDSMNPTETVEVFVKLGDIKEKQGEKNKALNMFEKALDSDPSNAEVLGRAVALYEEKGDLEAVLRCKKNMLKKAVDEQTKMNLAEEIGDLLVEKLKRPQEAITHYRMVTDLKKDHRRVLNKIMETFIDQRKWDDAIIAMGKLEDYETDQTHRSFLHYTAAVIYRDELKRPEEAAHHLDQALVKDPTNRRAFDALSALYTEQNNFRGLAKAYHIMLQRLPESTPVEEKVRLYHELGVICMEKLKDARGAIVAFEVADKLDPKNEKRQEHLAALYASAGPDAAEKAIQVNQRLLQNSPMRLEAYRELSRLYAETRQQDKVWCVTAVLTLLKKATPAELSFYKKHRPERPRRVARKLSDDLWREHLYSSRQAQVLNEIFAAVSPVIAPMVVRPQKMLGIRVGERLDAKNDPRPYAKAASYTSQVLDHTPSEMFVKGDLKEKLELVLTGTTDEMSTVLLVSPSLLKSESETELCFHFTRALAQLRSEHFLCFATQSATVLRAVALACLKLVRPATQIGGDVEVITKLVEELRVSLPPARFDQMAARAEELLRCSTEEKIVRWMEGVTLSTTRAALLLCDDFESAATVVSAEATSGGLDSKERLRELMVFAVSEPYFKLRELLGLQIRT